MASAAVDYKSASIKKLSDDVMAVGEGPFWDAENNVLYFVDIGQHRVYRHFQNRLEHVQLGTSRPGESLSRLSRPSFVCVSRTDRVGLTTTRNVRAAASGPDCNVVFFFVRRRRRRLRHTGGRAAGPVRRRAGHHAGQSPVEPQRENAQSRRAGRRGPRQGRQPVERREGRPQRVSVGR